MRLFMHGFLMFLFLGVLSTAQSCGKKSDKKNEPLHPVCTDKPTPQPQPLPDPLPEPLPEPEPVPEPEPEPEPQPEPAPVHKLKMNITFFGAEATPERIVKYKRAMCVMQRVVDTEEFKQKVLAYKYTSTTKTQAQVYQNILDANEKLQPEKDGEVDVEIQFYFADNSVVGYTSSNVKRVYVNTKFFDRYTPRSVAGNLMHEWLHKLGYGHDYEATPERPHSVPYAVGYMVSSLGSKQEGECP